MALSYFSRKSAPPTEADKPESQAEIEEQLKAARKYGASIGESGSTSVTAGTESSTAKQPPQDLGDAAIGQDVLTTEDEQFLERVASAADTAPLPWGDGGPTDEKEAAAVEETASNTPLPSDGSTEESNKRKGGWLPSMPQVPQMPNMPNLPQMPQGYGINSLPSLPNFRRTGAPATKRQKSIDGTSQPTAADEDPPEVAPTDEATSEQEKRNLTNLLGRLDLSVSSLNNRVISLSAPSKKLLSDFNNIIKDIVNGAPTAYDDLEKFLTQRDGEIKGLYESMPPFLQSLVSSLPMRMAAGLGPQFAAAAGAGLSGGGKSGAGTASAQSKSGEKGSRPGTSYVPSLKSLISQQGAVATMLRSIISFLESRFPMLLSGTNVVMSLALFLLMFVFYYCHKRGRETRIAQEGLQSDIEAANDDTLKRYREAQAQAKAGASGTSEKDAPADEKETPATSAPVLGDDTNEKGAPGVAMTGAATDDGLASVEEQGATDKDFAAKEADEKVASGVGETSTEAGGKSADVVNEEMPKVGRVATNPGS